MSVTRTCHGEKRSLLTKSAGRTLFKPSPKLLATHTRSLLEPSARVQAPAFKLSKSRHLPLSPTSKYHIAHHKVLTCKIKSVSIPLKSEDK